MMDIGRVCVKFAGRDADRKCVIIKILDEHFVLIDGQTRRKRCNIVHLEPLDQKLDVAEDASHEAVVSAFKAVGVEIEAKKPRQKKEKPKAARKAPKPKQEKAPKEEKQKPAKKEPKSKKEKKAPKKDEAPTS
ncbi:MAG: 50S ribosomal protein L14e [Nanoarchaeota archaeon]